MPEQDRVEKGAPIPDIQPISDDSNGNKEDNSTDSDDSDSSINSEENE